VIGYIAAEVLMAVFTAGAVVTVKWSGRLAKFAKLLKSIKPIAKILDKAEDVAQKGGQLVDKARVALKSRRARELGGGAGPKLVSRTVRLSGDTAGTGGIKKIAAERSRDGTLSVTISGELMPPLKRNAPGTPTFNRELPTGGAIDLPNHEVAHLWGPGFGDEARDGMMYAPREVNQAFQNHGIESRLRELETIARDSGAKIEVTARAESYPRDAWRGHEMLQHAAYSFQARLPDGTVKQIGEVDIWVPRPGTSGSVTVDVTGGSAGVWSLQ
jgi:hypothetical protein